MADDKSMGPSEESKDELMKAKQAAGGKEAADGSNADAKDRVQDADAAVKK